MHVPPVMPFGKYKGWSISDVPRDYLAWVLNNCERIDPALRRAIYEHLTQGAGPRPAPPPPRRPPDLGPLLESVPAVVTRARGRLAARMHPDRGGDCEAMQLVNGVADDAAAEVRAAFARFAQGA